MARLADLRTRKAPARAAPPLPAGEGPETGRFGWTGHRGAVRPAGSPAARPEPPPRWPRSGTDGRDPEENEVPTGLWWLLAVLFSLLSWGRLLEAVL